MIPRSLIISVAELDVRRIEKGKGEVGTVQG